MYTYAINNVRYRVTAVKLQGNRRQKEGIRHDRERMLIGSFCLLYVLVQLPFLMQFPFIHSDETWLSGLSRTILRDFDFSATEYFFDEYARNPHALKIVFHLLQSGWIALFGYSLFALRLLSLLAGSWSLYLLQRLLRRLGASPFFSVSGMLLTAFNIQFVYASHTVRQEIFLILLSLAGLYLITMGNGRPDRKFDLLAGAVTGTALGFHPNGVLLIFPALAVYGFLMHRDGSVKLGKPLVFLAAAGLVMLIFPLVSVLENPDFFADYLSYGATLGVADDLSVKIGRFPDFYLKIYHGVSGTYYTPPVKIHFFIFGAVCAGILLTLIADLAAGRGLENARGVLILGLGLVGMQIGIILIGRYGQPSVVLNLPLMVILTVLFLSSTAGRAGRRGTAAVLILTVAFLLLTLGNGLSAVRGEMRRNSSYADYREAVTAAVPAGATVLANLNSEPFFAYGMLYDWRNIGALSEQGGDFAAYVRDRRIEYIIYPDELDFIFQRRPLWNGVYGNLAPVYEEMKEFIATECVETARFPSRTYAMRIVRYQGEQEWEVRIYRVLDR